jgi:hypothetical protein
MAVGVVLIGLIMRTLLHVSIYYVVVRSKLNA